MIGVRNFYWVLYQNLLDPVRLDAWYYYPFGTMENLSRYEFRAWAPKQDSHVLFHFDQEPLFSTDLGSLYTEENKGTIWLHSLRLLANSEKSSIKKVICREYEMLDWYYFYHGFAALDWFRDGEFVDLNCDPVNTFLCMNHLVTEKRAYRMSLLARLFQAGVLQNGTVSFHGTKQDCWSELANKNSPLSQSDKQIVQTWIESDQSLPIKPDGERHSSASADFGYHELKFWQKSIWHLVTETVFYDDKLHLTEKVFKPIVAMRPFILVAAPGNLAYLKSYGFKTFDRWIDESYDSDIDNDVRQEKIVKEVQRLSAMPFAQQIEMLSDMSDVLQFNKQHFYGKFREIIVEELVDNFDQCIRIWNNGRVDRIWPSHPDLGSIKKRLLG